MTRAKQIKTILIHLGFVFLAAVLFAASFPNPLIEYGIPFFAWFAFFPILVVIKKYSVLSCAGWGAVYALLAYSLFNYWLGTFHPLAGTIVYSIYMIYLAAVFVLLKLAVIFFPNKGYLVQWLIWLAYEYLRTLGFLGYTYGIIGYSQWRMIPLIQIASITGVWGVSALVTFPSFWVGSLVKNDLKSHASCKTPVLQLLPLKNACFAAFRRETARAVAKVTNFCNWLSHLKKEKIPAIIWAVALTMSIVFGLGSIRDFSSHPQAKIALIQHNIDPWASSHAPAFSLILEGYRNDLEILTRLSDEALADEPETQLVVWPETAFVPRIHWHTTYREHQQLWLIVRDLLEYLSRQDVPFLIGNDDARRNPAINPNADENFRVSYNAALLFERGEITGIYRKVHLVPFTEHFPFYRQFPGIYRALRAADTHFWESGDEFTVFDGPGFRFSTPICFEDTFGYISREFVRGGADVLVNMSNIAWANSLSSQNQHLSKAVFRAVENFRPVVRSTTSGQTAAIDPNGRVIGLAQPFTQAWLNAKVPLVEGKTLYTRFGDYLGLFFTIAAAGLLIFGTIWYKIKK